MSALDKFISESSNRRVIVGVLVATVLCAALIWAYFGFLHKPYAVLFSKLKPLDAATIVADLDKKKTPYRLQDGGTTILVPANRVDATRLSEASGELPLKGVVGFELFNKSDMGLTEFAQKINYQRALQGELARTIMTIDGVDTARVHLSMPEPSIFRDDRRPPKASVAILMQTGKSLSISVVSGIQRLVAAAVPDLDPANVVVIDDRGEIVSSDALQTPAVSAQGEQRRAIQEYYAGKVRQAIDKVFPPGGVDVAVTVLDPQGQAVDSAQDKDNVSTDAASSIGDWSPDDRKFGLNVEIRSKSPLNAKRREDLQALAGEAIGIDPGRGDSISIAQAAPDATLLTDPPGLRRVDATGVAETVASPRGSDGLSPTNYWLVLLTPALAVLVGLAVLLGARRRHGSRRLSEAERQDYARQLSDLLAGEDAHVVRRL